MRQRFRDWQKAQADRLRSDIRVAEEQVYSATKVSIQSGQRAQMALAEARERELVFDDRCFALRRLVVGIKKLNDLNAALEALDDAEEELDEGGKAGDLGLLERR